MGASLLRVGHSRGLRFDGESLPALMDVEDVDRTRRGCALLMELPPKTVSLSRMQSRLCRSRSVSPESPRAVVATP